MIHPKLPFKYNTHAVSSIIIPYRTVPKLSTLLKLSSHLVPLEPKMLHIYNRITTQVHSEKGGIFSRCFDGDYCLDDYSHIVTIPFLPCVILTSEKRYKTYEDIIIMTLRHHYLRQAQQKHLGVNCGDDTRFEAYNPIPTHINLHDICIRRLTKYSGGSRNISDLQGS